MNHMGHNYSASVNIIREMSIVALGAILGATLRMMLAQLPILNYQSMLLINLTGAFALGLLLTVSPSRFTRLFLATGLLGGFTTTSALAITALQDFSSSPSIALLYLFVTFYGGLILFRIAGKLNQHA